MTRVDENREAQRVAEQRRLEEQQKAKQREASAGFQKVVAQKQAGAREAQRQQTGARARGEQQAEKQAKGSASAALLARHGIQSRNLAESLHRQGERSVERAGVESRGRREEVSEKEARREDRRDRVEREERGTHDPLAAIAGDEGREKGAGGGEGGAGMDMGGQRQPGMAAVAPPAAEGQAPAAHAPRMPPEVVQRLVERVFAGVTPDGLSQFTIELKGDVLGGARLDVTGKDGKISCTFHTDDRNVGRLLKASEGALARAFAQKGLTLDRLEVVER